MDRYQREAEVHTYLSAWHRWMAQTALASRAMSGFASAMQRSADAEVAAHPDLMELDVQLDGYYGG